jgi:hypothetical protein
VDSATKPAVDSATKPAVDSATKPAVDSATKPAVDSATKPAVAGAIPQTAILVDVRDINTVHDRVMVTALTTLLAVWLAIMFVVGAVFARDVRTLQLVVDSFDARSYSLLREAANQRGYRDEKLNIDPADDELENLLKVSIAVSNDLENATAIPAMDSRFLSDGLSLPGLTGQQTETPLPASPWQNAEPDLPDPELPAADFPEPYQPDSSLEASMLSEPSPPDPVRPRPSLLLAARKAAIKIQASRPPTTQPDLEQLEQRMTELLATRDKAIVKEAVRTLAPSIVQYIKKTYLRHRNPES